MCFIWKHTCAARQLGKCQVSIPGHCCGAIGPRLSNATRISFLHSAPFPEWLQQKYNSALDLPSVQSGPAGDTKPLQGNSFSTPDFARPNEMSGLLHGFPNWAWPRAAELALAIWSSKELVRSLLDHETDPQIYELLFVSWSEQQYLFLRRRPSQ